MYHSDHLPKQKCGLSQQIDRAVLEIKRGEVVAFPTDTFVALGADALSAFALAKLRKLKARPDVMPIPILISDIDGMDAVAREVSDDAFALAERFWPGPLTIILRKTDKVPDLATGGLDSVGVRIPDHPVALEIISAVGVPVTGTSANISTYPPARSPREALGIFPNLAAIVDKPCGKWNLPSTVVDMSRSVPRIVRRGAVPLAELQRIVPKTKWDEG